jgi:energy-coupling factor transporter transmembrane protein EcfT
MNPIALLCVYLAFSVSVLLSTEIGILTLHIIAGIGLIFIERDRWQEWKIRTGPFWKYFPLTGLIFFTISFLVTDRPMQIIIMDVTFATIRLIVMVSVMTIYTLQSNSQDFITAIRSMWFGMNRQWRWVEDLLIFFDMTIRFFPTFKEEWKQMERSQKALSIPVADSFSSKAFQIAQFIPDFVILNLKKADSISHGMEMRGYGKSIPRSVFSFIPFTLLDFLLCILFIATLIGVHSFGKI